MSGIPGRLALRLRQILRGALALTLAMAVLTTSTACSFFVGSRQNLTINSDPSGAEVSINGQNVGATPLVFSVPRDESSAIMVRKAGYETATRTTSRRLSAVGILDIVGTFFFIVPILGLIAPGAWNQEPENISVVLSKKEAAAVDSAAPQVRLP